MVSLREVGGLDISIQDADARGLPGDDLGPDRVKWYV